MRLEITDDIGFKWVLRIANRLGGKRAMLLMHCHPYGGWVTPVPREAGVNEYLCLYYYDRDKPSIPIEQRDWSCGACSHKVPPEVVEYYKKVEWGLDTGMFDDEDGVL
jgi:hypothetical protein